MVECQAKELGFSEGNGESLKIFEQKSEMIKAVFCMLTWPQTVKGFGPGEEFSDKEIMQSSFSQWFVECLLGARQHAGYRGCGGEKERHSLLQPNTLASN